MLIEDIFDSDDFDPEERKEVLQNKFNILNIQNTELLNSLRTLYANMDLQGDIALQRPRTDELDQYSEMGVRNSFWVRNTSRYLPEMRVVTKKYKKLVVRMKRMKATMRKV